MLDRVVRQLRCPVCGSGFIADAGGVSCAAGHRFDSSAQGYLNLLSHRSRRFGDTAEMVAARARFLGSGHYGRLAAAIAALAQANAAPDDLILEAGAGTAWYLARVLDALPRAVGLAVDSSKYAVRRAAKAHPRVNAIVADVWDRLPVAGEAAGLTLNIFAPRQPVELHRTLRRSGALLVVTPRPHHLAELRGVVQLLDIDPRKESRLAAGLGPYFQTGAAESLEWQMHLAKADVAALVAMGPSARHLDPGAVENRIAGLTDPVIVTAAVTIQAFHRV
jgi:23S rRNA (guanine745-N1)-methyltransferase